METGLSGKVVLVTGAGRNLGRATAIEFAREGANLLLCTRAAMELVEDTAREASSFGVKVATHQCDVSKEAEVERLAAYGLDQFGQIDVLINNATWRTMKPLLETPFEEVEHYVAVNVMGPMHLSRAVLPSMMKRKWGRIINFTGIGAYRSAMYNIVAMGRMAEVGFTRALARECGPFGITVNCVGPGAIEAKRDPGEAPRPHVRAAIPRTGSQAELAALLIYLCSENAGYITGQTILVNGGRYFL